MAVATLISGVSTSDIWSGGTVDYKPDLGNETSEFKILTQRRQNEEEKKARYHWSLLRDSIKNVCQAVEHADAKDTTISHGIYHDRKINHTHDIQHAVFIPQKKEYLTADGKLFQIFYSDGRKKVTVKLEEGMNRVVYASQTNQYIGWIHKESTLFLMNENFEVKSQSRTTGNIYLADYNPCTGEIITVGPGFITCWAFRYNARHLIPRKSVNTKFAGGNMFSIMVLEETASQRQRLFFACANGVVVYSVLEGELLVHRKELHVRTITAMTFFNPLKYLITGAQDGCIKVWDKNWQVVMVFVGHSQAVNALAIYPHGPSFISASHDCTIRVWSFETCDEVDKTSLTEPVKGLFTLMNYDVFFTFSGTKIDLWNLQHLYYVHTNIGYRVNRIKLTTHPGFPARAVLLCRDSSVRIVSPPSGEVLTTLLMAPFVGIVDAAYAIAENTMFVVKGNGDIIKCRTDVNPCKILASWKCSSPEEICSCLLVYEYVVDPIEASMWSKTSAETTAGSHKKSESRNRTLLLGGRQDGYICVYNRQTGHAYFKVDAHEKKGVLSMIANSKLNQLITAGKDNIIKVWRIFAFAEEALAPMMSFYCAHSPAHLSTIKSSLCVAFQDPDTATFSIVLYNLPDKDRRDHKPDDDHRDTITGLTSCGRMKLFASSSMDGTVRIWNEQNILVRVLRLNAIPNSIAFCSSRGDLLLGVGQHLFHIPWKKYLPKPYLRKMVSMRFMLPKPEEPLQYDIDSLSVMDKDDVRRMKSAHASFKIVDFEDTRTVDENEQVRLEKMTKTKAFQELELRENELGLIRDGAKSPQKKPKISKQTKREAMENYLKIIYNRERVQLLPEDPFLEDIVNARLQPQKELDVEEDRYKPASSQGTFLEEVGGQRLSARTGHRPITGGFVPNSVLLKLLYPQPSSLPEPSTSKPYRPPELTAKQLSEIRALRKHGDDTYSTGRSVTFAETEESFDLSARVIEFDLDEEEEEEEEEEEASRLAGTASMASEKEKSERELTTVSLPSVHVSEAASAPTPVSTQSTILQTVNRKKKVVKIKEEEEDEEELSESSRGQSNLMAKIKDIMTKPPSPKVPEEPEAPPASPEPQPSPTAREPQQPLRPIKKLVSRPRVQVVTPPAPRSPTPAPPPTPLPVFIAQFVDEEWFVKYFPNCNATTMPKPWSSDVFITMIIKLLRFAPFPDKTCVAEAIALVHNQEPLSEVTCQAAQKMLLTGLNHYTHPPNPSVPKEKVFIMAALRALKVLGRCDKDFVLEMLAQFLDGDQEIRAVVMDSLRFIGMHDPHRQVQKELDSWDIWNLGEADRKKGLLSLCGQWLDRWMTSYKLHIKDTVERLQKGQNVHGRLSREALVSRGTLTRASQKGSAVQYAETVTSQPGSEMSLTITIDHPDMEAGDNATYLDVLNYFCEIMTEKEVEALRRGEELRRSSDHESSNQVKNTVLVLPKIDKKPALVRLGETHTSKCRPKRETIFSANYAEMMMQSKAKQLPPGSLEGFVPCINLPMKTVYLNPFPSAIDVNDPRFSEPILITLRTTQKYFFPSQSCVESES